MIANYLNKRLEKRLNRSFLVIDKEPGKTSHDEVFLLRRTVYKNLNIKIKVGHSGTLDPKVTGVLVCGFGQATRALEYILLSKKIYIAEFLFHQQIEREKFEKILSEFLGKIEQLPPVKSAVKREVRTREIYDLKILDYAENKRWAILKTSVERGTYIRKLAHDIGLKIGVTISMGDLRRIWAGVFSENNSNLIKSSDFSNLIKNFSSKCFLKKVFYYFKIKKYLFSLEDFFLRLEKENKVKKIYLKKEALRYLRAGNNLRVKNILLNVDLKEIQSKKIITIFYKKKFLAIVELLKDLDGDLAKIDREEEIFKVKKLFWKA